MKTIAVSIFGMMIFLCGCSNSATNSYNKPNAKLASNISIKLTPKLSTYSAGDVPYGSVSFYAVIENKGSEPITIAHPVGVSCFNAKSRYGEEKARHGKSEILLKIIKPDGNIVILHDGWFGFEPDAKDHLYIAPDETEMFYVGWFFENARGKWGKDDSKAWKVFLDKGKYKVLIIFRNASPKAVININKEIDGNKLVDVWIGEMQSEEITVDIK